MCVNVLILKLLNSSSCNYFPMKNYVSQDQTWDIHLYYSQQFILHAGETKMLNKTQIFVHLSFFIIYFFLMLSATVDYKDLFQLSEAVMLKISEKYSQVLHL